MVKIFCVMLFLMLISSNESFAQEEKDTVTIVRMPLILEKNNDIDLVSNIIIDNIGEDIFGAQLQFLNDDIERILQTRISLRTAAWKDLQEVPTLTDLDIYQILKNQKEGIINDADAALRSRYYLMRTPKISSADITIRSRVEIDPDAYKEAVYQNGTYHGSPLKTTSRFIAKTDNILFAITEAKNPGEPLYFDHLTGCFAVTKPILITDDVALTKFIGGDYSLSYGSGLLFSSGYSQLPTSNVSASVAPRAIGIKPYISSSSFRYFQGAAAELSAGIFSTSGFFSDRKIDASMDSSGITSLTPSVYHRTTSELARRAQAENKVIGAHISATPLSDDTFLEFGATAYTLNYDKPVIAKDSFSSGFHGQQHSMISLDMRAAFSFISWNGEFARMISDAGIANAISVTAITAPFSFLEFAMNYHDLPANFISPFGGVAGNFGAPQNETAWYAGAKVSVLPKSFWFFGSVNFSKTDNISKGEVRFSDVRLGSTYILQTFPLRLSMQLRSYGVGSAFALVNDSVAKNSFLFTADGDITKTISISLRTELQHTPSHLNSDLLGVGIDYLPVEEFSVGSGISFFRTDSYAVRFYSYEEDLPGAVPFVSLYGTGYRYYLLVSYDLSAACTFSARVAQTTYSISGGSLTHKTMIGAQIDLAF